MALALGLRLPGPSGLFECAALRSIQQRGSNMGSRMRAALSYSNVIATLALVIALGGTS